MTDRNILNIAFYRKEPAVSELRGILKKCASTPNLLPNLVTNGEEIIDEETPDILKGTPERRVVKFRYVSPLDRWRIRKRIISASTDSLISICRDEQPNMPSNKDAEPSSSKRGRTNERNRQQIRERSRSRPLCNDIERDIAIISEFLAAHPRQFRAQQDLDLYNLSILQYLELVKSISDTFDGRIFKKIDSTYSYQTKLNIKIKLYMELTLELAKRIKLNDFVNEQLLQKPISPHLSCTIRKKKLLFLKTLIHYGAEQMD